MKNITSFAGGIAAIVASLLTGCSSAGPGELGFQKVTVRSYNPTKEARRNIEFLLPIQNPRFYDQHKFKAGETVRYAVFRSDGVGGTLNCTPQYILKVQHEN